MSINAIVPSVEYNVNIRPAWVSVNTSDNLATVMGVGYLNGQGAPFVTWTNDLMCMVTTSDTTPVWLAVTIVGSDVVLVAPSSV